PLTPLRAPVRGRYAFPADSRPFPVCSTPFRPSAASPRPPPQPHPERLWDAGRGPGRQRNGMVNNRLWMARAPVLCVPLRTPDRQAHEAHRGGDQPGVDAVAVQGEAGGRENVTPFSDTPTETSGVEGVDTTSKDSRERWRGGSSSRSKVPTGGETLLSLVLIEVAGFLDRPRR